MSGKKTRLVDTQDVFNVLSDYYHHNSATQHLALQEALNKVPTVDAVPLDGSFLKMSRGDYLIYKRHWLYEHFDQEIDIQRSAMKSMGYEPALKDTEPRWIPCSERLPEEHEWIGTKDFGTTISDEVYVTFENPKGEKFCKHLSFQNGKLSPHTQREIDAWHKGSIPIAWMPLPKPARLEETDG